MKYFKVFNTKSEYLAYISSKDFISPNVSTLRDCTNTWINPETHDYSKDYFTIESLEDNNEIKLYRGVGGGAMDTLNIAASTDGGNTWTEFALDGSIENTTDITTLNQGEKVMFKYLSGATSREDFSHTRIVSTASFNVYGNVMSFVSAGDFTTATTLYWYNRPLRLLQESRVISAENLVLPATTLASGSYRSMFDGCTLLTTAPSALPATTLATRCYYDMFKDCTSLTETPELPATTLAIECYMEMFKGCTSLTATTELTATTMYADCYRSMFDGCTSLTATPELPATTLATRCYRSMFGNCTNLEEAPELPATTLAIDCYYYMFGACTSLTTAPELPATTLANNCYYLMFMSCTSLTTAPELPATTLAQSCYSQMFQGCTSLTETPELPATTLAQNCYQNMFQGCTSLTEASTSIGNSSTAIPSGACYYMFQGCTSLTVAPELPATTLTNECYKAMFKGCTSLTVAPELPATTLTDGCYKEMFDGCTSLTTAPELPATTLVDSCYSRMFNSCTKLTTAPELPARTLADNCYHQMFKDCNELNYIKCLATDISATDCTKEWVYHVQNSSGTFVKYVSMSDWTKSNPNDGSNSKGIPSAWTVVDYSNVHVTGVTISSTAETITKGGSVTLTATVTPNDAYDKVVTWSTSDSTVATVNDGVVTAVGCGNAIITVTTRDGGLTAQCTTTVKNPVTSVTLNSNVTYILTGETYQLVATVAPSDACGDKSVTWSTSDSSIATVSNNGLVTAVATGSAVVTVTTTVGSYTATCAVEVTEPVAVTGVTLNESTLDIVVGQTSTLVATVLPNNATNKNVTWSSSDSNVATVDSDGVVSGVASGSATITVTTVDGGLTAQCSVSVSEEHDYSKDYFTIESLQDSNEIKMQRAKTPNNPTLSYSLDNGETWTTATISGTKSFGTINTGDKIIFKGTNTKFASAWDTYNYFTSTKKFKVYGNIMSLFNGDDFKENSEFNSSATHHCAGLFRTTYLVDASNLILPATTVGVSTYNGMFRGCTNLVNCPRLLPATTLYQDTYSSMFEGCTSLVEGPEIMATTIANTSSTSCMQRMFCMNRNNKVTAAMTKSPILRIADPNVATNTYKELFKGNGALVEVTILAQGTSLSFDNWLTNTNSSGVIKKLSTTTFTSGNNGLPSGWTTEDID